MASVFVTGISTEVGKTVASAILVEALQADYWKPVQAGDLHHTDSHEIKRLTTDNTTIHPSSYALKTPISPHAAAAIDGIQIHVDEFKRPKTVNHLVIEGAGGLLVPLNKRDTMLDLIDPDDLVVVVSKHYLGSINHTLLTVERLLSKTSRILLLFNGKEHSTTEEIIKLKTEARVLGRIEPETRIDCNTIKRYAQVFRPVLLDSLQL